MTDIYTKLKRSQVMSKIRSKGNRDTELALVRLFKVSRITGWRRNYDLIGKPDFVFLKTRVAVFVDGCFWHGCPTHGTNPKSNSDYWSVKLARNRSRDREVTAALRNKGWIVFRFWEHDLKEPEVLLRKIRRTTGQLRLARPFEARSNTDQ